MSEIVMYVIRGSMDQTEGRTGYVDRELFSDLGLAVKILLSGKWGVQGVAAHSDLVQRTLTDVEGRWVVEDHKMWGHHRSKDGKWRYGWTDDRDVAEFHDPDFAKYLELKQKFEKE